MASFSSVTDLKPFKTMWKIRVRIIRLWKQYSAAGGLTIERVVVDCNVNFLMFFLLSYKPMFFYQTKLKESILLPMFFSGREDSCVCEERFG